MEIGKLDHIGVAVRDMERAIAQYEKTLGGKVRSRHPNHNNEVDAAFVLIGDTAIEFLAPTKVGSVMDKFLEKRGEGIHHLAYEVPDIHRAVQTLIADGLTPLDREPRPGILGELIFFFHPKSTHGVLIELVEATPEGV
ncbi:MAG: methylmalonyl-CoA epimerase [Nitrospinota bacterium]|nr:methylmalonyl-CoA epimerase [Nitrospinota bacterium]MDP6618153.1 methylmalonyl-CoA epimerase [Nitrospinota bacterium]